MFCPDCGRESQERERFCPTCGYPLAHLEDRLRREQEDSLGWAERLVGKRDHELKPPRETPLLSFKSGEEPPKQPEPEEEERKCERCGAKADVGALCPSCGDKLPSLTDGDPHLPVVLRGLRRIVFAPRSFALNLPYPATGGTLQPTVYSGVFAAVFLVTLPFSRADYWLGTDGAANPLMPAFAIFPLYLFGIPLLTYLSAGLIHIVAVVLGGYVPFRRAIRVVAAGLIWLMLIGAVYHLLRAFYFWVLPHIPDHLAARYYFERIYRLVSGRDHILLAWVLAFVAWQYAWMLGGLYRLSWWKTVAHFFATYWLLALIWVIVMIVLPLHLGGLL